MTLRDADYYSEQALNERELAKTAAEKKSRQIRKDVDRQYDALLRSVPPEAPESNS
jgi:hypothetical protein